jgi:hypothetical protein
MSRRRGNIDTARSTFTDGIERTDLDWPEAVFEAFLRFETIHGDLNTLAEATNRIYVEEVKLAKRRQKATQEQLNQYYAEAIPVEQTTAASIENSTTTAEASGAERATNSTQALPEATIKRCVLALRKGRI